VHGRDGARVRDVEHERYAGDEATAEATGAPPGSNVSAAAACREAGAASSIGTSGSAAGPAPAGRPVPDGSAEPLDVDAIEALGDEIAVVFAHIDAGTGRVLEMIARFDRARGWELAGHRTCAHWLAFRAGLDLRTAREHVRVARALEELPRTGASLARGRLSFSKVRALTRVATPENEADLLELAEGSTAAQLERVVRAWKRGSRKDEIEWEELRRASRELSIFPDDDGMYVIHGRLEPEAGALLMRAIEAASDALYRSECEEGDHGSAEPSGIDDQGRFEDEERFHDGEHLEEAARRRADAIGLVAERALAAGFGGADQLSGTRAERYQVLLHVDAATLSADQEPGRSELEDGTRVSAETSRRVACDASVVEVAHDADGSILDVGRRTRTIPSPLRRALEVRDRGCRFPGCGLRFTDAHHVTHWADGGETSLQNTVLLCRYHHRLVHEGGWALEWWGPGRAVFRDPRGGVHCDAMREEASWRRARENRGGTDARAADLPDPGNDLASELVAGNLRRGIYPGPLTGSARWKRERDIPDDVLFRSAEASL